MRKARRCILKNKLIALLFFLTFQISSKGQNSDINLIENGSFEHLDSRENRFVTTMIERADPWLGQSVDLYSPNSYKFYVRKPPTNIRAKEGDNFIGLVLYDNGIYEAVSCPLKTKLTKNCQYKISIFYRLEKNSAKVLSDKFFINLVFTDTLNKIGNNIFFRNYPTKLDSIKFFPSKNWKDWNYFEAEFVAQGYEKYLMVRTGFPSPDKYLYIYYDDFKLELIGNEKNCDPDSFIALNQSAGIKSEKIILKDFTFEYDTYTLKDDAKKLLDSLVNSLLDKEIKLISVNGYTDDQGSDDYNNELSLKRAESAADYLIYKGISRDIISFNGYGEKSPIASNKTEQGRNENRRVEIIIEFLP